MQGRSDVQELTSMWSRLLLVLTLSVIATLYSACATIVGKSSEALVPKQEIEATAPTCRTVAECEVAWAAARQWVEDNAGYQLQTYSSDLMETYVPLGSERALAARVSKEPVGNGSYRIIASFSCGSDYGCSLRPDVALRSFDQFVAARIGVTRDSSSVAPRGGV